MFHFLSVSCVALCSICLFTRIHVLISRFLFVGCKHFFAPLLHFLFSFSPMISQSPPLSALTTRLGINKTGTKSVLCKIFNKGVNFLSIVNKDSKQRHGDRIMKQLHAPDFICKTRQRYFLQRKESVTCWQLSSDNIPGMNYHELVAT